ncbi:MAG: MaoC/PaaZ C-terminal domain-containing protein [Thermodesulfobacteriota bacterium]
MRFGVAFNELKVGDKFEDRRTITEADVVKSAGLFRDFNALHTNEPEMKNSRFGTRIVHGALTFGLMVGVYSNVFHDTDISTVDASIQFQAPVFINDTITMTWEVAELEEKKKLDGGLVKLKGQVTNTEGKILATTDAKLLVGNQTIF